MGLENPLHIAVLVIVLFLIFGAKRFPEMARALGSSLNEFRTGLHGGIGSAPSALPAAQAAGHAPAAQAPAGNLASEQER
jgi:sec-independent protein translocase protein TatA